MPKLMRNAVAIFLNSRLFSVCQKLINKTKSYFLKYLPNQDSDVIFVQPRGPSKGNVLISYITSPFRLSPGEKIPHSHSNLWECKQIVQIFVELGYNVEVIDYFNKSFMPRKPYKYFIDIHSNMERLTPLLNRDCTKILHITGAHWIFQNHAEYSRLLDLKNRRGFILVPRRVVPPSLGIEYCDCATILGNEFTLNTFIYAHKPIYSIPISCPLTFDFPERKDFNNCHKNFLWFGGSGMVHKGLDRVLEAFASMPEYKLTICGPVKGEQDFERAYYNELYKTPNITTIGWVDVASPQFIDIMNNCIALIYPSCSEGMAGSVIICMHGGLIPIVSYESGIDVNDLGFMLKTSSIEEIIETIKKVSNLSIETLWKLAKNAWLFARTNHTQQKFAEEYARVIDIFENNRKKMFLN